MVGDGIPADQGSATNKRGLDISFCSGYLYFNQGSVTSQRYIGGCFYSYRNPEAWSKEIIFLFQEGVLEHRKNMGLDIGRTD